MKRPSRKRARLHRKTTPPPGIDLTAIAEEVKYVGSPEHKATPSFAGRPAPRADASLCDASLASQRDVVQAWLRQALCRGDCGGPWEGRFPRYVWCRAGEVAYQARLTNRDTGEYKGHPIALDECPI